VIEPEVSGSKREFVVRKAESGNGFYANYANWRGGYKYVAPTVLGAF